MSFFSFLLLILIAAITGSVGASIAGRKKLGCLPSVALGFVGALLGTFIAQNLDLPILWSIRLGNHGFPVIWAVMGAALFVALLNLFSRR